MPEFYNMPERCPFCGVPDDWFTEPTEDGTATCTNCGRTVEGLCPNLDVPDPSLPLEPEELDD